MQQDLLWDRVPQLHRRLTAVVPVHLTVLLVLAVVQTAAVLFYAFCIVALPVWNILGPHRADPLAGHAMAAAAQVLVGICLAIASLTVPAYVLGQFAQDERSTMRRHLGTIPLRSQDWPATYAALTDMAIACGLPKPPGLYIIHAFGANACILGRSTSRSAVAVTHDFLGSLTPDEQRAVFANLLTRLRWRDTRWALLLGLAHRFPSISAIGVRGLDRAFHRVEVARHVHAARVADEAGMLLLRDPDAMLGALLKTVGTESGSGLPPGWEWLFYRWPGSLTKDEQQLETTRIEHMRGLLGIPPAERAAAGQNR